MSRSTDEQILSGRESRRRAELDTWLDDQAAQGPKAGAQYSSPAGPPSPTLGQRAGQAAQQDLAALPGKARAVGQAATAGVVAGAESIAAGTKNVIEGLLTVTSALPVGASGSGEWSGRMKGIKRIVDGLFEIGLSPAAAVTGAAASGVEQAAPGALDLVMVPPITSGFIRSMMGGATGNPQVDNAPMSGREALGIVGAVLFGVGVHGAVGRSGAARGGRGALEPSTAREVPAEGQRALPGGAPKALPPAPAIEQPGGFGPIPARGTVEGFAMPEQTGPKALPPAPAGATGGAIPLGMSPMERYAILEQLRGEGKLEPLMRAVQEQAQAQAQTAEVGKGKEAAKPAAPFFETTPAGEKQAMIPGTEGRAIPDAKTQAKGPQAGPEGTLFEKPATATQTEIPAEPVRTQGAVIHERMPEELRPVAEAAEAAIAEVLPKAKPGEINFDVFLKVFEDVPELATTERGGVVAGERISVNTILGDMAAELEAAQPGKRIMIRERIEGKGKRDRFMAEPSTYPPYMGELGVERTKKGANKLLDALSNVLEGKTEGPLEQKIVAYAERAAQEQQSRAEGRSFVDRLREQGAFGEQGSAEAALLARMGIGALLGAATEDTPEERLRNAFIGMGLGAALSTRIASRIIDRVAKQGSTTLGMGMGPAGEFQFMPNFRWIASTEKVKTFLKEMHEEPTFIKDLERQARGIRTHEATETAARRLLKEGKVTGTKILGYDEGTILNAEEATAARKVMIAAANQAVLVAERIANGQAKPSDNLRHAITVAGAIARNVDAVMTETGRALNAFKIMAEGDIPVRVSPARIAELADSLAPGMTEARLVEMVRELKEPEQVGRFAKWMQWLPNDALMEVYYGVVLLSNPLTQVRNLVGNTYATLTAMAERQAAGLRPGSEVALGEAGSMAMAGLESLREAFRFARGASEAAVKLDAPVNLREPSFTAERLGVDPSTPWGAGLDYLGKYARLNLGALESMDRFFRFLNFSMERKAQAIRRAEGEGFTGAARHQRIAEMWNDPPRDLLEQSWRFAEDQTFSRAFEGRMRSFQDSTSHPLVKMLVLPFLRTPIRLAEYAAERTPVLNLLSQQFRDDFMAGGARRELAMAKVGMGALISLSAAYAAFQGLVTGNMPKDPDDRRAWELEGKQPLSIRNPVTGGYSSYANLEPLSSQIAVVADIVDLMKKAPDDVDYGTQFGQLISAAAFASIRNLASKQYLQSIGDVMEAIQSDTPDRVLTFAQRRLGAWVPAIVGQAERIKDPAVREAENLVEEWQRRIPFISEWLVPRRNIITGEPITSSPGRSTDPVLLEVARLDGAGIRAPAAWLAGSRPSMGTIPMDEPSAGQGVPLNKREYDRLIQIMTGEKFGGKTLREALGDLIASDAYKRQSDGVDGGKALVLRRVFHGYVEAARAKLRQESPDLESKIRGRMQERAIQRAPTDQQGQLRELLGTLNR